MNSCQRSTDRHEILHGSQSQSHTRLCIMAQYPYVHPNGGPEIKNVGPAMTVTIKCCNRSQAVSINIRRSQWVNNIPTEATSTATCIWLTTVTFCYVFIHLYLLKIYKTKQQQSQSSDATSFSLSATL